MIKQFAPFNYFKQSDKLQLQSKIEILFAAPRQIFNATILFNGKVSDMLMAAYAFEFMLCNSNISS